MNGGERVVNLEQRNRRVLRIILGVMATLIVASFLVGIRW